MRSAWHIIVVAGLILPFSVAAQDEPFPTQSGTAMSAGRQPPATVNGKVSSPANGTAKQQKVGPHKSATGKLAPAQATSGPAGSEAPKKVVVRQGGVSEQSAQIIPDMDPAEAIRKREDSERLLGLADENLKRLAGRALTEQEQDTVSHIDRYMTVARSALKEGDISRGHTLALKANLLAADLAKH
jgi:hypothetical protein